MTNLLIFLLILINSAESLFDRLSAAYKMRSKSIEFSTGLSLMRGQSNVEKWEQQSTEPWMKGGEWHREEEERRSSQAGCC